MQAAQPEDSAECKGPELHPPRGRTASWSAAAGPMHAQPCGHDEYCIGDMHRGQARREHRGLPRAHEGIPVELPCASPCIPMHPLLAWAWAWGSRDPTRRAQKMMSRPKIARSEACTRVEGRVEEHGSKGRRWGCMYASMWGADIASPSSTSSSAGVVPSGRAQHSTPHAMPPSTALTASRTTPARRHHERYGVCERQTLQLCMATGVSMNPCIWWAGSERKLEGASGRGAGDRADRGGPG